uniref:Protein kinase domain-containing protein n=1 Tax=Dunaliella tertiolecta TaxID=3047 RepID=A0A7S3VP23_DUNTE
MDDATRGFLARDREECPLFCLALQRLLGPAYVSPWSLAFVHEIAETAMQITEQAWLLEGSHHRRGVVVKSYRPHAFQKRGRPLRFRELARQMQMLQTLKHRHLVSVIGMGSYQHDSWEDVCNSLFLVEEYAGPMTVAKLIKGMAMHSFEMFLCYNYGDAIKWLEQLAEALAYLHSQGICHGDVRCQNIFFTSPDVHQTDVRLGDLKPHRASYLQRSSLVARDVQEGEETPAPASTQHSLQNFNQQSLNQAGSDANALREYPGMPNGLFLPAISEDPVACVAGLRSMPSKEGLRSAGSGSLSSSFIAAATGTSYTRVPSNNTAQAGSAASSFVQPASSKHSFVQTASSSMAQAGSAASSFVQPASSKRTPSKSIGQLPYSRLSFQSGEDEDAGHSQATPPHPSHTHSQAASLGDSKDARSEPNPQEYEAWTQHLLEQVAKECPRASNKGTRSRRSARASWSLGVGPTMRLGLPQAPDTDTKYRQQGMKKVASACRLPALDSSPPQSSTQPLRTATQPSLSPLLAQQPSTLPPLPLAMSASRHHTADAPTVGGQLGGSVPTPRSSGSGSFPPLQQMGSGFLMATGGTALARAAKQQQHHHQLQQQQQQQQHTAAAHNRNSSSSGAEGPGALRSALRTSTSGGRSHMSVTTLGPPYGGGSGGSGAPLPFDDGWASPFSWNSHAANMGSLTRLPNEPAPWSHQALVANHHKAHGSDRLPAGANPYARFSYTHAHDFADMWKGIDADVSVRSKLTSEMKDQVDTAYDKSMKGGKAFMQSQQSPQQQNKHQPAQDDGQEQPMGNGQLHSSMRRSLKKSVSFAAELPSGKLPAWDVAVVYLSPEILTAAREQKEGQVNRSAPVTPTQESDTFAFAKVMYQLLWRSLLEPRASSAAEELSAIQEYGLRVASGYREQVPYYWPEPVRALLEECWAQNPSERPPMAVVKERLAAIRSDEHVKRELASADKHHRLCVRSGTSPGSVTLANPAEASCGCSVS